MVCYTLNYHGIFFFTQGNDGAEKNVILPIEPIENAI